MRFIRRSGCRNYFRAAVKQKREITMNRIYYKPYLAELKHTKEYERKFIYPRENLAREPLFSYLILDGGAYFFAADHFGDATAETLLEKTLSGQAFDIFRNEDGSIEWGKSYLIAEKSGMPKQHEWQSWPQRLYFLLPLAKAFMVTHDGKYSSEWVRLLRDWIDKSPYEPLCADVEHTKTSMKWRDMQGSWRTQTLIYSIYMLGTHEDAFSKETWKQIYDFLELNLNHLCEEAQSALERSILGNHTLQMATALISAGTIFVEFDKAREYYEAGIKVMKACYDANVLPDGGTRETGPSYNHFIARLYLEAQKNCELNGYPGIDGLHESLIRQYQYLATIATKTGDSLLFSDAYRMDAHKDVKDMAKLIPFTPDFIKKSVLLNNSGYLFLRNNRWELAVDAQKSFGGHQHYGRIQPVLWRNGEEILVDSGCCNYDRGDFYFWLMSADAHSVVACDFFPDKPEIYDVDIADFNQEENSVEVRVKATLNQDWYVWTRKIIMKDETVDFIDEVSASREFPFYGYWYLASRPTVLTNDTTGAIEKYCNTGFIAKQRLNEGVLTVTSDVPMSLQRMPMMSTSNNLSYSERITWRSETKRIKVHTIFSYAGQT